MKDHRLTSKEMAHFVASGYLRFENMIPADLCDACLEEIRQHKGYLAVGTPFEETWPKNTPLGEAFRLPQVQGLIHSLVGPDPLYDHHGPHLVKGGMCRSRICTRTRLSTSAMIISIYSCRYFQPIRPTRWGVHFWCREHSSAMSARARSTSTNKCLARSGRHVRRGRYTFGTLAFGRGA